MRACPYRAFRMTPDVSVSFWRRVLAIWGRIPYSNGTCVVHIAIGQVTIWDRDYVWVLEISLVHDMYGPLINQIAPTNNVNNY